MPFVMYKAISYYAQVTYQHCVEPIWAKFSDIFGRRCIFLLVLGVFVVGSILCGVAQVGQLGEKGCCAVTINDFLHTNA